MIVARKNDPTIVSRFLKSANRHRDIRATFAIAETSPNVMARVSLLNPIVAIRIRGEADASFESAAPTRGNIRCRASKL
ncbi:MAG TPA: hypothetical protein VFU97_07610 [Xanthobacteraceae bacterium]|jgi:hypothetical protein|nr:hypothetical protein [Xanthobacteraceae bacterium]